MIERELRAHICASLLEMPSFVEAALAQLPSELLVRAPHCDRSPLLEHAWHLRDCDEDLYAMRIRRAIAEEQPFLEPMDISHWVEQRAYMSRPIGEAMAQFREGRTRLVAQVSEFGQEQFLRLAKRGDGSSSTVMALIGELLSHDQDHRLRISATRESYAAKGAA
jgi:hypothetical protein